MFELGIIIPTRDEANRLGAVLDEVHAVVVGSGLSTEVVVVDDGSTDKTLDVARRAAVELPLLHLSVLETAHPGGGFGALLRFGAAYATARYVVVLSADGNDPIELVPDMVAALRGGAQLAICSRYQEDAPAPSVERRFRIYQRLYREAIRLVIGQPITDSTNGFRAFDRRFALALGLSSQRLSICPELTFKTLLAGGSIVYVDGQPRHAPSTGVGRFTLPHEFVGYAHVLVRAGLHRLGLRWF
jgi:glycosyltransferase involved in cell wall biosynthesis